MNRRKIFVDFDNTIANSTETFCFFYNEFYKNHPNFKEAKWWKINQWNFSDQCTLLNGDNENVEEIFASELFFEKLDFLNGNTYVILKQLCLEYEVIIVTIGTHQNVALKTMWIKENLPFIKECVFLVNDGCKMNKSIVNMRGGLFLDDVYSNLISSNADVKICVGDEYSWNKDWLGLRCINWTDIGNLLL